MSDRDPSVEREPRGNGSLRPGSDPATASPDYHNELIEFSADAIVSIDEYGHIGIFNKAAERLFGYSKAEAIGQNIKMLMPREHSSRHDRYLANYRETGKANILDRWREVEGLRKDGTMIPLEIGVREFTVDGRRTFAGIVRDLTEIKNAQREIESRARDVLELSTPAIAVWDGVLVLPLIGTLDSHRMQTCTERALNRLRDDNAQVLIIDITGVPVMDTMVANHLIALASAIGLMGGRCILTGISPATAVSIVNLGLDLSALNTRGTLKEGLKLAIEMAEEGTKPA